MMALTLEFGVAGRIARGERVSGDLEVVHYLGDGAGVLIALIDGIGHGESAAALARRAADTLLEDIDAGVEQALQRCHAALGGSAGAAACLARVDLPRAQLHWLSVGNSIALLERDASGDGTPQALPRSPGILGQGELPALSSSVIPLRPRDQLILATDGIDPEFSAQLPEGVSAQAVADGIIARHGPRNDDALVVVVRAG
jgi:phosphoserine phosphatase RsbX